MQEKKINLLKKVNFHDKCPCFIGAPVLKLWRNNIL